MKKSEVRNSQLLEMLQLSKRLDVNTISDTLGVSVATVRRQLSRLEAEGKVIRNARRCLPCPASRHGLFLLCIVDAQEPGESCHREGGGRDRHLG